MLRSLATVSRFAIKCSAILTARLLNCHVFLRTSPTDFPKLLLLLNYPSRPFFLERINESKNYYSLYSIQLHYSFCSSTLLKAARTSRIVELMMRLFARRTMIEWQFAFLQVQLQRLIAVRRAPSNYKSRLARQEIEYILNAFAQTRAYDHTTLNTPHLVRSGKLSNVGPG